MSISRAQVFISVWDKDFRQDVLQSAKELRRAGISVETYLEEGSIGRQLKFAAEKNIPYCLIFGPDERDKKEVTIKEMQTGVQVTLPQNKLVGFLRSKLKI